VRAGWCETCGKRLPPALLERAVGSAAPDAGVAPLPDAAAVRDAGSEMPKAAQPAKRRRPTLPPWDGSLAPGRSPRKPFDEATCAGAIIGLFGGGLALAVTCYCTWKGFEWGITEGGQLGLPLALGGAVVGMIVGGTASLLIIGCIILLYSLIR